MATIREEAQAYKPPMTLNIADLEQVPIDNLQVKVKESENAEGKKFTYKYVVIDNNEYRIPNTVFEEIQTIIKLKPETKIVKVNKSGSGLNTRYKVDVIQ